MSADLSTADLAGALTELRDRLAAATGAACSLGATAATGAGGNGAAAATQATLVAEVIALLPVDPRQAVDLIQVDARIQVTAVGGDHLHRAALVCTSMFGLLADRRWQLDPGPPHGSGSALAPAYTVTITLRRQTSRPAPPPVRHPLEVRPQRAPTAGASTTATRAARSITPDSSTTEPAVPHR